MPPWRSEIFFERRDVPDAARVFAVQFFRPGAVLVVSAVALVDDSARAVIGNLPSAIRIGLSAVNDPAARCLDLPDPGGDLSFVGFDDIQDLPDMLAHEVITRSGISHRSSPLLEQYLSR
jgi:hypothetical protein